MIVIVEGIDRVGKTTLCEKLREERGYVILKDSLEYFSEKCFHTADISLASAAKIETTFAFLKQLHDSGVNVVVDRCHLTEKVYGTINRGFCGSSWIDDFEDKLISELRNKALLILVEPTNIDEACQRAGEDLEPHAKSFAKLFEKSRMHKYKTTFFKLDDAVNYVAECEDACETYDFYLASPFFRPDQVERESRIKHWLRGLGYNVFSPKEASFLKGDASLDEQEATFDGNCEAIKNSTAVFAITDTKDMGTIWEAGYAFGIDKPIIYYAETLGNNPFNLMLAQSGCAVLQDQSAESESKIEAVMAYQDKFAFGGVIE